MPTTAYAVNDQPARVRRCARRLVPHSGTERRRPIDIAVANIAHHDTVRCPRSSDDRCGSHNVGNGFIHRAATEPGRERVYELVDGQRCKPRT